MRPPPGTSVDDPAISRSMPCLARRAGPVRAQTSPDARRIDRVGPPSEIFTPDYIAALYRMEPGKYDPCFDSLEFVPGGAR